MKIRHILFDLRMEIWLTRSFRAILAGRQLPRPPRFIILLVVIAAIGFVACDDSINCSDGWKRNGGVTRTLDSTRNGHRR